MKQINKNYSNVLMAVLLSGFFGVTLMNPILVKADAYSNNDQKTISIDKKLRFVNDPKYVDNISSAMRTFSNGDLVEFFVKVTNSGDVNLKNIKVTDNLPPFLKLIFYPGQYNPTDNKIEWVIDELNPGHSQKFLIRGRIDKASEVKTLTKETNIANVWVDGIEARDDATYYILNKVTTTVNDGKGEIIIPVTGSGDLILETIGVISVGLTGLAMRKKIRGF